MADELALSPKQKAAAVVIAVGAQHASEIYKHLNESELEQLTYEVAKIGSLPSSVIESVLDDFYKMCMTQKVVTDGGLDYARSVLEKAFGAQSATSLLERITKSLRTRSFDFVRDGDSKNLIAMLQHERAQTIALVLAYARSDQAAAVIAELPKQKQIQVVEAIAKMESASPETIRAVEGVLQKKFDTVFSVDYAQVGGVDYTADVMNNMDRTNEKFIFDELSKKDIKLADDIRRRMFIFEDVTSLDDMAIQKTLREVDNQDLVLALKGATPEVSEAIFANMSSRMAETVRSDLEITGNVRLRDVEEAQSRIVAIIRRLEDEGEIVVAKGGKDEIIA